MRYMLDTNACIHIIKYRPGMLWERFSTLSIGDIAISSIVAAELWYGIALSQKKKQIEEALRDFLDYVEVMDWPSGAGPIYGQSRGDLKTRGTPIGTMNLLVAVHALFLDAVLVTDNVKEFARVRGLKTENWLDR